MWPVSPVCSCLIKCIKPNLVITKVYGLAYAPSAHTACGANGLWLGTLRLAAKELQPPLVLTEGAPQPHELDHTTSCSIFTMSMGVCAVVDIGYSISLIRCKTHVFVMLRLCFDFSFNADMRVFFS